ncbi:tetratricopeptide repeat domain-containing protein [Hirsutella rhossiliensis]|uniref:Tetratricopeptide repeat domain-containing protein n=1 Tax=Hirsutella rhossiliensis TaxID=111463 RepID=A0A9P8SGG0_9HYPO|nr:tetratricopeptide repeat domain-containing protein [Hirsutella rhossiliensis]KAH0959946.1 tetratricopeptide repeat domain-containing protein [Hirsutella rhossiliensis]
MQPLIAPPTGGPSVVAMDVTSQASGAVQRSLNGDPTAATTAYTPESHGEAVRALSVLADGKLAGDLIKAHVSQLANSSTPTLSQTFATGTHAADILAVGLAALDAFLQANVTGPVLPTNLISSIEDRFANAWIASCEQGSHSTAPSTAIQNLRRACIADLDVDGVAPYSHIPYLELFSLARFVILYALASESSQIVIDASPQGTRCSIGWTKLRVNVWHYKLLTQPSLGRGSNFTKSSQWSDVPTLASTILDSMDALSGHVCGDQVLSTAEIWTREEKTHFLVEAANNYILLGYHDKAQRTLKEAAQTSGLEYALSGALGKRTRFQEKSTSQLVVLARSGGNAVSIENIQEDAKPDALPLNNDTLLEQIHFTKESDGTEAEAAALPPGLADLSPDGQPQLSPLDQIILLTEATIKDSFSPVDTLTSEEVLPFAVRVLTDKSTNWQIYTQALLVRSRIELHRSRTLERGVLQLQAVADQVLADTSSATKQPEKPAEGGSGTPDVPDIQVTAPGSETTTANSQTPATFLPAPKVSESAPAHIRLRYIHALSTPPRWHLESELAYAWAGVGSLTSALEIFKRLHLWAEVALCLASSAASDDEQGRGSGGEEKAKAIIRWRLFHRTGDEAPKTTDPDDEGIQDVTLLKPGDYAGPERTPPPPNAPRLWCILGDLEDDPGYYERAWEISSHRFARAQKSLGEHYLQRQDWRKARAAYKIATAVNRLSPEMWGRLGDISLRLGLFDEAAEAYGRSIGSSTDMAGGEDARTWSNLGSALWSLYCEVAADARNGNDKVDSDPVEAECDEGEAGAQATPGISRDPGTLLSQSLAAYKKGASIAHDNWRIWDNVLTLAARMEPPSVADIVLAFKHVLRIRQSEDAIDTDVLSALLQDVVLTKDKDAGSGVYEPPRGSMERLVTRLLEDDIVPLITQRAELWALVARLRTWRRDHAGAIDASEKAWRAAVGASGSGLLPGESAAASSSDWATGDDEAAWAEVVKRTDELVSVLENWGPGAECRWRGKARSAVRSVMGRARERWEGSEGWATLEAVMEGLKRDK